LALARYAVALEELVFEFFLFHLRPGGTGIAAATTIPADTEIGTDRDRDESPSR
jgi:hypothetical protein